MAVLKDNGCAISSKQHFSIAKGNYAISTLIYLEKLTLIRKTASKNILIFFDKYWQQNAALFFNPSIYAW